MHLLFGDFIIGTGVMAVPGTLPEISSSLAVSFSAVGQLISASTCACLGWSLASVPGLPLGAYIGGTLGWRSAFFLVGNLCMARRVLGLACHSG